MKLTVSRIILFTKDMPRLAHFYGQVLGLPVKSKEPGYLQFDAGGCAIALHNGTSKVGVRPPKITFAAKDVAAVRRELVARGAKFGKVSSGKGLDLCDGKDPDGNAIALSNRP